MNSIRYILLCLTITSISAYSASFDCGKAKTYHEKFICTNPELDSADKKLGESFMLSSKSFPLIGYIKTIHRSWLMEYRQCAGDDRKKKSQKEALASCLNLVNKRTILVLH